MMKFTLLIVIVLLPVAANCQHTREDCNGGLGVYETHKDSFKLTEEDRLNVESCLEKLRDKIDHNFGFFGCRSHKVSRCLCVVDSSYVFHWWQNFREAQDNLYKDTNGFNARNAYRHEGALYLFYKC
uniref:Uncharacterized protein n=1 Tax=Strigamia maritima TaxID=126957 RepID=T1IRM7_STRMM